MGRRPSILRQRLSREPAVLQSGRQMILPPSSASIESSVVQRWSIALPSGEKSDAETAGHQTLCRHRRSGWCRCDRITTLN
jgi:hypothetical protein